MTPVQPAGLMEKVVTHNFTSSGFFLIQPLLHLNSFSNPKLYIASPEDPQKRMHHLHLPHCNGEKDVHIWQHHALDCDL